METTPNGAQRTPNPRRRRRDPKRVFIQTYLLPIAIILIIILFIIFAIGSINRSNKRREEDRLASFASEQSEAAARQELEQEAEKRLTEADRLAAGYSYDEAVALLDTFSGNVNDFSKLSVARARYLSLKESLVAWSDPNKVTNISFHVLIAEPNRAFKDVDNGNSFRRNFITVSECTAILNQLYENNFVLVNWDDIVQTNVAADGTVTYSPATIYLPADKKPLIITQTHVNYNTYMVDGDDDGLADKYGSGFASRLILDNNGELTCEMVDSAGNVVTGAYDLVPLLNTFIKSHPDFSYRGAKAILAVSGYDGLFGYRTDPETADKIGVDYYNKQLAEVPAIIDALRKDGYTIACYTYGNLAYGETDLEKLQTDLVRWQAEVEPLLGKVDMLVYAKESEISDYAGDRYLMLQNAGFKHFLGFSFDGKTYMDFAGEYVRQGRILITGNRLENKPDLYSGLFDAQAVQDPGR